jgi:hypothetical protein
VIFWTRASAACAFLQTRSALMAVETAGGSAHTH